MLRKLLYSAETGSRTGCPDDPWDPSAGKASGAAKRPREGTSPDSGSDSDAGEVPEPPDVKNLLHLVEKTIDRKFAEMLPKLVDLVLPKVAEAIIGQVEASINFRCGELENKFEGEKRQLESSVHDLHSKHEALASEHRGLLTKTQVLEGKLAGLQGQTDLQAQAARESNLVAHNLPETVQDINLAGKVAEMFPRCQPRRSWRSKGLVRPGLVPEDPGQSSSGSQTQAVSIWP